MSSSISKPDPILIGHAGYFAMVAHRHQTRKYTGEPYVNHPASVAEMAFDLDMSSEAIAAAFLHDVLEDVPHVTSEFLTHLFGKQVSDLVVELTEVPTSGNRATRKAAEAARLAQVSEDAQTLKCLDLADNTKSIVEHDPKFAEVYLAEKAELLRVLTRAHPEARRRAQEAWDRANTELKRLGTDDTISACSQ